MQSYKAEGGALRASLACQGVMITFTSSSFPSSPWLYLTEGRLAGYPGRETQGNPESDALTDGAAAGGGLAAA